MEEKLSLERPLKDQNVQQDICSNLMVRTACLFHAAFGKQTVFNKTVREEKAHVSVGLS